MRCISTALGITLTSAVVAIAAALLAHARSVEPLPPFAKPPATTGRAHRATTAPAPADAIAAVAPTEARQELPLLKVATEIADLPPLPPMVRLPAPKAPPPSIDVPSDRGPTHTVTLSALNHRSQPSGTDRTASTSRGRVDVFFGGTYLTTVAATFNAGQIRFAHPAQLIGLIPNLVGPAQVLQSLSGWLDTHTDSDCRQPGRTDCTPIHPETVAVIFDATSRRADLLINPTLLVPRSALADKYLPASDANISLMQNINYAFNGEDADPYREFNLYSMTALSYKENALRVVSNFTSNDQFQVDSAVVHRDWRGKRYEAGWFNSDSQDLRFAPEANIAGIRIGTSIDTREDLRQAGGNALDVFLQSRGEVSVFKDGRLISSQRYDAGNQQLDTSALPGGAYDLEIRIRDSAGERTEHRFYVKNTNMPPPDTPFYFFEAGAVTVSDPLHPMPQRSGEYLFRGGLDTRLSGNSAIFTGVGSTADDATGEVGYFGVGSHYRVTVAGALARYQRSGVYSTLDLNFRDVALNASYRRIWGDPAEQRFGGVNLLGDVQEQSSLNLSLPAGNTSVELAARYNRRPGENVVSSYSIATHFSLLRTRGAVLGLRLEFARDDDRNFVLATFNWRTGYTSSDSPLTMSALQANNLAANDSATANADWSDGQRFGGDLRANLNAVENATRHTVAGNMDFTSGYGRARMQVERDVTSDAVGNDVERTRYNGNLSTTVMATPNTVTVAASEHDQAAVVIDLSHAARHASFNVLVDGDRQTTVRAGDRTVIPLTPFRTYRIRLEPRGNEAVALTQSERRVTLYPGNVVNLNWSTDVVDVISGRIVDSHGMPVRNAVIGGAVGDAHTDRYGLFHARMQKSSEYLTVQAHGRHCIVHIPETRRLQTDRSLGVFSCRLGQSMADNAGGPAPTAQAPS